MVQVQVREGNLEGELVDNEYGGQFYSFKGIPYAQPPVGDLRFKAPQPQKPWDGVRSAKDFGPICYQFDPMLGDMSHTGSEDCLYLNVYTPDLKPSAPLPVMFWIHGGAFISGSGNDDSYGPEFLIKHGVILVTFNYRLGALGFLSLDTEDIPGNAGMKDQVVALKWVKNNISNFGGDSENITIFGESAGGASVTFHLLSPMSKGLFKKAISQSGTAACSWAQSFEPRETALVLARQLGCFSENDKDLYDCFRSAPLESLVNVKLPVILASKPHELYFAIVNEKKFGDSERFFDKDVVDALKCGIHEGVDIMTGYNNDEGLIALTSYGSVDVLIDKANNSLEFFVPKPIQYNCLISKQLEAARKIKKIYLGNERVTPNNVDKLFTYFDLEMFVHGIALFVKKVASKKKNKVFFYKFTCQTERNIIGNLLNISNFIGNKMVTCHGDDLLYIFPFKLLPQKIDLESDTFKIMDRVISLWTNFAKYGNPTPDNSLDIKWTPYTMEKQDYLEIGNALKARKGNDREIEFWDDIFREFIPEYGINYTSTLKNKNECNLL